MNACECHDCRSDIRRLEDQVRQLVEDLATVRSELAQEIVSRRQAVARIREAL